MAGVAASKSMALPQGVELGHYRLLSKIGQGGFGITYLAQHVQTGEQVVVKENLPTFYATRNDATLQVMPLDVEDAAENYAHTLRRFVDEARLLAHLHHPNIVRVTDAFEALGTAYYVMPYIRGQELHKAAPAVVTETWLRPILCGVLSALEYLHGQNLLHRDIKPGNILLTEGGTPILIDFGTARALLSDRSATIVGTPGYTPIEQVTTHGKCGPWTDIYALGATCYRLITGERPPDSVDMLANESLYRPLSSRPELQDRFSAAFLQGVDKALAARSSKRWQTADLWKSTLIRENISPIVPAVQVDDTPTKRFSHPIIVDCLLLVFSVFVWFFGLNAQIVDEENRAVDSSMLAHFSGFRYVKTKKLPLNLKLDWEEKLLIELDSPRVATAPCIGGDSVSFNQLLSSDSPSKNDSGNKDKIGSSHGGSDALRKTFYDGIGVELPENKPKKDGLTAELRPEIPGLMQNPDMLVGWNVSGVGRLRDGGIVDEVEERRASLEVAQQVWVFDEDEEARKAVRGHDRWSLYAAPQTRMTDDLLPHYGRDYAEVAMPGKKDDPWACVEQLIGAAPEERAKVYREAFEELKVSGRDRADDYWALCGRIVRDETRAKVAAFKAREREVQGSLRKLDRYIAGEAYGEGEDALSEVDVANAATVLDSKKLEDAKAVRAFMQAYVKPLEGLDDAGDILGAVRELEDEFFECIGQDEQRAAMAYIALMGFAERIKKSNMVDAGDEFVVTMELALSRLTTTSSRPKACAILHRVIYHALGW